MPRSARRATAGLLSGALLTIGLSALAVSPASAATAADVAALAVANQGKTACGTNSLGGTGFETSCTGNDGQPEYWCADFVKWVWAEEGLDTSGLNAAAGSFVYSGAGTVHTGSSYAAQVGDAIVYNYEIDGNGTDVASHVGIVTAVNSDGSIDTENGDFGGESGTEATFASTSSVEEATISAAQKFVGDTPSSVGMEITDIVTPSGLTAPGPGSFHVFSVSPTGNLYQDTYSSGWTGWQNLDNDGENLTGDPGIAYDPDDGTYHAFAIGATSGNVYQVTYTPGSGWGNWQNLGGVLQGGVSAAYVDGTFHVFSVSPSGNLYQDTYSSGWTGWQNLDNDGENLTGAPGVVYDPDDGTYHVFAIGATSGNVYQVTYTPGSGWGNWQNLGGVLQGGVSAAYVDGTFHVFSVSPSGNLYQDTYSSGWTGWQNIGNDSENLTGAPGIAYDTYDGTYHAFAQGATSGNMYQVTYGSGGWGSWQNLGGALDDGFNAVYVPST